MQKYQGQKSHAHIGPPYQTSPKIGPETGFEALARNFLACGVFFARGAEFPKVANLCYAPVKLELAKFHR